MNDHMTDDTMDGSRGSGVVRRLRDERGATLALVALGSVVLIGCAAISIDLGMLMTAKSQAQRAADSGAHAGAVALARSGGNEDAARELAIASAADNEVMGEAVEVREEDVHVFPASDPDKVRVTVVRNRTRDNPIGTFFARILGFNEVDLAVDATARVATPGDFEVECLLPLTIQDRWWEDASGTLPGEDDEFHPESDPDDNEPDIYVPWGAEGFDESDYTGYSDEHRGERFVLKSNSAGANSDRYTPSWWNPWAPSEGQWGANEYRARVSGERCAEARGPGDVVSTEPGNMVGPTKQGFQDLINQDPDARWDGEKVVNSDFAVSPRVRAVPMWDPRFPPTHGRNEFTFTNFAGFFVEDIVGQDVIGVFLELVVTKTSDGDGGNSGMLPQSVEIIE
jgi:Flp pilus assembly protein TadG